MRNLASAAWRVARGFCGAFCLYVTLGGFAALVFAGPYDPVDACRPQYGFFGSVYADCDDALAKALWSGAVVVPRGMIVYPTVAFFGFYVWAFENNDVYVSAALTCLPHAMIAVVLMAIGLRDWFARAPLAAYAIGVAIVGQMAHLHWKLLHWPIFP